MRFLISALIRLYRGGSPKADYLFFGFKVYKANGGDERRLPEED